MGMLCHVKRVKDTIIGACRMQHSFNLLGVLPDKMKNTKWRRWEHDESTVVIVKHGRQLHHGIEDQTYDDDDANVEEMGTG